MQSIVNIEYTLMDFFSFSNITDPSKIKIRCGDWDQKDDDIEIIRHQDVAVKGGLISEIILIFRSNH